MNYKITKEMYSAANKRTTFEKTLTSLMDNNMQTEFLLIYPLFIEQTRITSKMFRVNEIYPEFEKYYILCKNQETEKQDFIKAY